MPKKITIEVDIPDGWEFVKFAKPCQGEYFLDSKGNVIQATFNYFNEVHFIVRRAWQQPDFLNPGWIAMDQNDDVWWYEKEPIEGLGGWNASEGDLCEIPFCVKLEIPCDDWRTSKRRIV